MTEIAPLAEEHRALLLQSSVPTLASILYRKGFTNTVLAGITQVNPAAERFVGVARTVRTLPVRADLLARQTAGETPNLQGQSVEQARAGDVLVVDMGGETRTAFMGDIMATHLWAKGAAAAVLDGGVSDAAAMAGIAMPVFARGNIPRPLTSHRIVFDLDVAVSCGGVTILPGDILMGDGNGVIAIPRALVPEVAEAGADREALEAFVIEKVRGGAPLTGTYPPNEATLQEYETRRQSH